MRLAWPFCIGSGGPGASWRVAGARAAAAGKPDLSPVVEREREVLRSLRLPESLVEDDLKRLAELFQGLSLLRELTPRSLDHVAAFGERMCVKAIARLLRSRHV